MSTPSLIPMTSSDCVLTFSCPDRPGIVYTVSRFLVEHECNIVESQQFTNRGSGGFFMRLRFEPTRDLPLDLPALRTDFAQVAARLELTWRLLAAERRQRLLVLVSRAGHCLNDLLFRAADGTLGIEVAAVISNHPDLAVMADAYRVPFHHVPVTADAKPAAEARLLELVAELEVDLVVLARYMQILSAELCRRLEGRAINIHHSILPSFKGARPYFQAYERGVKLVGATAHYVTPDLDEGPIIAQAVAQVDHSMTAQQVTELGRDNECRALSRAVRWHAENRVLLDGNRTVVFA
jgi:formyltetrahydrofolate deformylase